MAVLVAIETIVVALLTLLVAGLLRSHAEILRRLHDMGVDLEQAPGGAPVALRPRGDAPRSGGLGTGHDVGGAGLHDDVLHVPVVGTRHRTLLAFLSSGCLTCRTFWEQLAHHDSLGLPADVRVLAVTKDPAEESISALRDLAPADLPVVMSSAAWESYGVPGSPYFVLVDGASGRIHGEGTGLTWPQVRNLILQAGGDDVIDATREARIDAELLAHGIAPGDPSLYRTAEQIAHETRS